MKTDKTIYTATELVISKRGEILIYTMLLFIVMLLLSVSIHSNIESPQKVQLITYSTAAVLMNLYLPNAINVVTNEIIKEDANENSLLFVGTNIINDEKPPNKDAKINRLSSLLILQSFAHMYNKI